MNNESYKIMISSYNHWWYKARRKIIKKVLDTYINKRLDHGVLEIGCGNGANIELLSNYGDFSGVEMESSTRKIAKKINPNIYSGYLPNNIESNQTYSLICLLDVLEHIERDIDSLITISNMLNNKGNLLITVPAYKFLWNVHDDACHHKRRYILKDLTKKLEATGYSIKYQTYFNNFLFLPITIMKLLSKFKKKPKNELITFNNISIFNNFFEKIFSFEAFFLPKHKFRFGISILILAEKNN